MNAAGSSSLDSFATAATFSEHPIGRPACSQYTTSPPNRPQESPGPPPLPRDTITLRVSNERFLVRPDTLTRESIFFRALLSSQWSQAEADGSYFLDCDPAVFKYVLRYLRVGAFPLCLTKHQYHDYDMYSNILAMADYLGIDELVTWLQEQRYREAVTIRWRQSWWGDELDQRELVCGSRSTTQVFFHDNRRSVWIYQCPRAFLHHDSPEECERAGNGRCANALGPSLWEGQYFERVETGTLVREKVVTVNYELLRPSGRPYRREENDLGRNRM